MGWSLEPRSPAARFPSTVPIGSGITLTRGGFPDSRANVIVLLTTTERPPHQIMTWVGLERYGYLEDAQRLSYRFLYM